MPSLLANSRSPQIIRDAATEIVATYKAAWLDPAFGDRQFYAWPSTPAQLAIRQAVRLHKYVAIRSANSMGKTSDILAKTAIDLIMTENPDLTRKQAEKVFNDN